MKKLQSSILFSGCFLLAQPVRSTTIPSWREKLDDLPRSKRQLRLNGISTQRQLQLSAMQSCQADAQQNEEFLRDIGLKCSCKERDVGVVLICMDDFAYCNDARTICGVQAAQALYDLETGLRSGIGGAFEYVTGFHETIAVENLGCREQNGVFECDTCSIYVSGEQCNSCELVRCGDGTFAESIECENIERGAVFNFCNDITIGDDSVFTALSSGQFEEPLPLDVLGLEESHESRSSGSRSKSGKSSKKGKGNGHSGKGGKKGSKKGGYEDSYDYDYEEEYHPHYEGSPIFEDYSKSTKRAKSRR